MTPLITDLPGCIVPFQFWRSNCSGDEPFANASIAPKSAEQVSSAMRPGGRGSQIAPFIRRYRGPPIKTDTLVAAPLLTPLRAQ